jgi:hypothetical protein
MALLLWHIMKCNNNILCQSCKLVVHSHFAYICLALCYQVVLIVVLLSYVRGYEPAISAMYVMEVRV